MTVYYAHPMAIYGTPQEDRDIETLENLGFTVVNPNTFDIADQCRDIRRRFGVDASSVMMLTIFLPMVGRCEALAFRAFPDGSIPTGVVNEIRGARDAGLPVFELPSAIGRRSLSIEHTREYLAEIGQR